MLSVIPFSISFLIFLESEQRPPTVFIFSPRCSVTTFLSSLHQGRSHMGFSLLFLKYPITFLPFNKCVPCAVPRLMSPRSPRLSPCRGTSGETPSPPPQPCSGDVTQEQSKRNKQCGGLSGSPRFLACFSRLGAQMLNSAVGTLPAHLSYLTLTNTSSTYSHSNTLQRSFRPNGLHTKTRQACSDESSGRIDNSHLLGKIKGFLFFLWPLKIMY